MRNNSQCTPTFAPYWLCSLLDRTDVVYEIIPFRRDCRGVVEPAYYRSFGEVVRTLVLQVGFNNAMVVSPQNKVVILAQLAASLGVAAVRRPSNVLHMDCDLQAIPPFGAHYGMPVYVPCEVAAQAQINFFAGNLNTLFCMGMSDFRRLVAPRVFSLFSPIEQHPSDGRESPRISTGYQLRSARSATL